MAKNNNITGILVRIGIVIGCVLAVSLTIYIISRLMARPEAADQSTGSLTTAASQIPEPVQTTGAETEPSDEEEMNSVDVSQLIDQMTLAEKVAQLFIISPEQLTGLEMVTEADENFRQAFEKYPVGGLILFAGNLEDPVQITQLNHELQMISQEQSGLPLFLSIDEEGGDVARIGKHKNFPVEKVPQMKTIGASGQASKAFEAGAVIGAYLNDYGFNMDFAPVADVLSNADNAVVKTRSFGEDANLVAEMAAAFLDGLELHQVLGVPKHFPGHGATQGDTHDGFSYTNKTWEQLEETELVPFYAMVEQEVPFIMVGHISLPMILGDNTPASLSAAVIQGYLREVMNYDGLIITDALNMGAVQNHYPAGEAAVMTLTAGADLLLMPADFPAAYEAVLAAVENGQITEARLDESLVRILSLKIKMQESK